VLNGRQTTVSPPSCHFASVNLKQTTEANGPKVGAGRTATQIVDALTASAIATTKSADED
jgi:hypothetical protein